jgi:hypothetical protein
MTRFGFPQCLLPPGPEVAPVYFSPDDAFSLNDHPKTWNLPDSAVALLHRAGEWSARNAHYGHVPASMLARFSSDPVRAAGELVRRGLWQRVKGGYQFCDWDRIGETEGRARARNAGAAAERSVKSAGGKLGNHERWHVRKGRRAPGCGFCEAAGPVENPPVKTDIAGAIGVRSDSDPGATPIDRSDLDLDQSVQGGQAKSDARARESPELVTAVADAICAKVGYVPTDAQALAVIAAIRARAAKAGRRIRNALKYIPQSVANEPDLYAGLLDGDPPPLAALTGKAPPGPDVPHEYQPVPGGGPCLCGYMRSSPRHDVARTG